MSCCGLGGRQAALLSHFSAALEKADGEQQIRMLFPMYTVSLEVFFGMRELQPHEALKAQGLLSRFDARMGNAAFVSHQWLGVDHPDPEGKQMRILQAALQHAMSDMEHIPLDIMTQVVIPTLKPMPTSELRTAPLFLWYDYFSCPQCRAGEQADLSKAISSIPVYVAQCTFFFVVCPVLEGEASVLSPITWSRRGWCRLERACCELGQKQPWSHGLPLAGMNLFYLFSHVGCSRKLSLLDIFFPGVLIKWKLPDLADLTFFVFALSDFLHPIPARELFWQFLV